jgi:hypothetical protein
MSAEAAPPAQAAPPTVEEVLEVLLLRFEAAADGLVFRSKAVLAYAEAHTIKATGQSSILVWTTENLHNTPPDVSSLSFLPPSLPGAWARWNMCDFFAWLLEAEANRKLQQYFGATADWLWVKPKPTLLLSSQEIPNTVMDHSVLVIDRPGHQSMVMDGTPAQLAWKRSTWYIPQSEFTDTRMAAPTAWRWVLQADRAFADAVYPDCDDGYWGWVKPLMEELFGELDWDALLALPRAQRVEKVKEQAEAKFADAWEQEASASEDD